MVDTAAHAEAIATRDGALTVVDDHALMDEWFNVTDRGTGTVLAAKLDAAQARQLHSLG